MNSIISDICSLFYIVSISPEKEYVTIDDVPDYVTNVIPYFLLLIAFELLYGKYRKYRLYTLKDTVMSISLGIVQQIITLWIKELLIIPYAFIFKLFQPFRQNIINNYLNIFLMDHYLSSFQWNLILFVIGFFGCDLGYYFVHRYSHEWHILWCAHSVHHSGERYNLATALRQGSFQSVYSWVFYLPLAMIGFPIQHFIRHNRLNLIYQFWIHTEIIGKFPWMIELIMNTPSHHRVHHRPPGNCNYAGVLIIWDRLFGTFISENSLYPTNYEDVGDLNKTNHQVAITNYANNTSNVTDIVNPKYSSTFKSNSRGFIYGLAKPLNSFDPVFANLNHFIYLILPILTKKNDRTSTMLVSNTDDLEHKEHPTTIIQLVSNYFLNFNMKMFQILYILTRKRVKEPLFRIHWSYNTLFPDIIQDCNILTNSYRSNGFFFGYLKQLLGQIFELPPIIIMNKENNYLNNIIETNDKINKNELLFNNILTTRDQDFVIGRELREFSSMNLLKICIVLFHFMITLIISFLILLFVKPNDELKLLLPTIIISISFLDWIVISVYCILALQLIKLYY